MNMSVFYLTRPMRYYLTHPLKFFSDIGRMLKRARQRAVYGWCDMDTWEMDVWFLEVVPRMLRKLATDGRSYPGYGKWDSPEKWNSYLFSLADKFSSMTEEATEARNRYSQKYYDSIMSFEVGKTNEDNSFKELSKKYFEEWTRLSEENKKTKKEAFEMLSECFNSLWD